MPTIIIDLALKSLGVLREYWGQFSLGAAVIFLALWGRGCAVSNALSLELEACNAKPPAVQAVAVQGRAAQSVRVIFRDGSPCPDLFAENTTETSVSVTQTAGNAPKCPPAAPWALQIGLGYQVRPYAIVGLRTGAVTVFGTMSQEAAGGGLAWDAIKW